MSSFLALSTFYDTISGVDGKKGLRLRLSVTRLHSVTLASLHHRERLLDVLTAVLEVLRMLMDWSSLRGKILETTMSINQVNI